MNEEVQEKEVAIDRIVVMYADGTSKTIEKGMVVEMATGKDDMVNVTIECMHISGQELISFVGYMADNFLRPAEEEEDV